MDEPEYVEETPLFERARLTIPGGTSTGSKRVEAIFGHDAPELPSHYLSALGCEITLTDGRVITDCTMALGAVSIGYADELVNHAVMRAIGAGNVSAFAPALEIDLAERLSEVIPCAENVRFLKSGAEGTAAAVRLARAATGRTHVLGCGYFGWLDWCSTAEGVPAGVRKDYSEIPFNDVASLEKSAAAVGKDLAAIIIEPVIGSLPDSKWIEAARSVCDRAGAVLIFDEIKTGFRLRRGGYQEFSGITPDIAVFGKAMGNGFPIAAVVGSANVMSAAEKTWISSTLACETSALAAVEAMLEWHERAEVCESLEANGAEMRNSVRGAIESSGITGVEMEGIDQMWSLRFDDSARESRFLALALEQDVLFKRGAYNFASLGHDDAAQKAIEQACSTAMVALLEEESHAEDDAD